MDDVKLDLALEILKENHERFFKTVKIISNFKEIGYNNVDEQIRNFLENLSERELNYFVEKIVFES